MNDPANEVPIQLAATVLVVRQGGSGLEVLLMRRASELAFHGGAWVFPGGRIDPSDHVYREPFDPADEGCDRVLDPLATARRAAVRETFEEAGLTLEPHTLVPLSHWTTPRGRPRRFATWFFAAPFTHSNEVVIDGAEIRAHRWMSAADALTARACGELELPPPTFVTLSMLRPFADTETLFAHLHANEPPVFLPRLHKVENGEITVYRGDAAYDGGPLDQPGPRHRLQMLKSGWCYERS